jgi:hypothetical protein
MHPIGDLVLIHCNVYKKAFRFFNYLWALGIEGEQSPRDKIVINRIVKICIDGCFQLYAVR